jgi:2'-5' RNA ligase
VKPFVFRHGTGKWPAGETLLHVYAIPDLERNPELAVLAQGCRDALAPYPVTFVEDRWLHITLMQIADKFGARYTPAERAELAAALRADLAGFGAFDLTIGSCLAQTTVVMFDVHPDDRIGKLGQTVHETVGRVRGDSALSYNAGVPHMTVGYASGTADNADIQRDLRKVRPGHAPMHIKSVEFVEVTIDPKAKTVTWEQLESIPLS